MAKQERIFIAWSGHLGNKVAELLKDTLLFNVGLEPWVSSRDIPAGSTWVTQLFKVLGNCKHAIVCLTPGSSKKPWINFESGIVFGRLENVKLLTFKEELGGPFEGIQALDGFRKENILTLLKSIMPDPTKADKYLEQNYPEWDKQLQLIFNDPTINVNDVNLAENGLLKSTLTLISHSDILRHPYYRFILVKTLDQTSHYISGATTSQSCRIPAGMYPEYLLALLRKFEPTVKAIALVNQDELFWSDYPGEEIRKVTSPTCTRVFVFRDEKQLREYQTIVLRHARKYAVYLLSDKILSSRFPDYRYDFSIIGGTQNSLLALYDDTDPLAKAIRFSRDTKEISAHEDAINEIIGCAHRVGPPVVSKSVEEINRLEDVNIFEELVKRVFLPIKRGSLVDLEKKTIEMSAYITIYDYDEHEEKHAYYQDMMDYMINEAIRRGARDNGAVKLLELGAGTGIFTRRLAKHFPNTQVLAVEIDWACYRLLEHKMRVGNFENVKCVNEDSRTYDPDGKFHCIFSSFADHHIKPPDKLRYMENLKRNLTPDGFVIVGDEFLRPYNKDLPQARREALEAYHKHIIAIAQANNESKVAALEEAALESGLTERGDFKLSCQEYEDLIRGVGFKFERYLVGPHKDTDKIGGVYVYVLTPQT